MKLTNKKNNDFNSVFWHILGVNHKVFEFTDIFPPISKEKTHTRYKNMRNKEADEKANERFLRDNLKNEDKVLHFKTNEILHFTQLLRDVIRDDKDYKFFRDQFFNVIISSIGFSRRLLSTEKIINIFAFQLAFIITYMQEHDLNTELLELSIKDNSLEAFFNECKNRTKCKTYADLATEMSHKHEKLIDTMFQYSIYLEPISPSTFKKDISNWKNNKNLPNLTHIFTISNTLDKNVNRKKGDNFIQLLLARSLLHIEKEHNISLQMKENFIEKFRFFQMEIKSLCENNPIKILELRDKYVKDFSIILDIDPDELKKLSTIG